ncbi:MAG: rhomboid family intramembrane serine protease [Nannocystaceae bacterium]|nr:rhomboid family intramembrane serine protease [Nannocystaceae bacterium]
MGKVKEERETWRTRVAAAPMTAAIAALCGLGFLASLGPCIATSGDPGGVALESLWSLGECRPSLVRVGALELARVWLDGEWWRVASTGLLHGSWIHLLLNIWSLVAVGEWAERLWGSGRLGVLFALCSVSGCLASLGWAEAPMVVGASAGIFGIAGALLVARVIGRPSTREQLAPISVGMLGGCLAVLLAVGFFVPLIAQAGHIGGLVAGLILGAAWARLPRRVDHLGVLGVGALCAGLVGAGRWPVGRGGFDEFVGYRLLEEQRFDEAGLALERALANRPDDAALANAVAYAFAEADTRLDRAKALVDGALAAEPGNADFLDTLGWVQCRRGEFAAGLAALDAAEEASDQLIPEIDRHRQACR